MRTRAKLLVGLGVLLALGLIAATISEAPRLLRERRILGLLRDRSTVPNLTDSYFWDSEKVVVAEVDTDGMLRAESHWFGSGPLDTVDLAFPGRPIRYGLRRRPPRPNGPRPLAAGARLLVFENELRTAIRGALADDGPAEGYSTGVGVLASGLVLWPIDHGFGGMAPCGKEDAVRARAHHVVAIRRAFDATKGTPRVHLLQAFLETDVRDARRAAIDSLALCGEEGVLVLQRFLEDDQEGELLAAAVDSIQTSKAANAELAILRYLAREVAFWRCAPASISRTWSTDATSPLADHRAGTSRALDALREIGSKNCATEVNAFRALYARFPPCWDGKLESAVAAIGSVVDARDP